MKRKIGTAVVGLSVLGFGIFGFTHGNGGGIVQAASVGDGGGAPAYGHTHFPAPKLEADGDHHAPSYAHGNTGAPTYTHGEGWSPSYAHGDHGGASAYNGGDTPAPKLGSEGHTGGEPANTEPGGGI
ncbi:hypothetical protein BCY92_12560 [Bacillus wiedmannii]|uniref:hypothetical protein n=1 Tax=Bacillus wiedmannii TaxID=1890302 RepID=UPI000955DA10|nr:hypothetical protein BCY92_12560 [Bacillus wiedmannii]SIQ88316.1 hypothetical protein SAMN05878494_2747 [Bacillus cereus]